MPDLMTRDMGVGYGMALEDVEEILTKYVGPRNIIFLEFNALKAAHKGEPYELPDRSGFNEDTTRSNKA